MHNFGGSVRYIDIRHYSRSHKRKKPKEMMNDKASAIQVLTELVRLENQKEEKNLDFIKMATKEIELLGNQK